MFGSKNSIGALKVSEAELPIAMEYINYHQKFNWRKIENDQKKIIKEAKKSLLSKSCPLEQKKDFLFALAHIGILESLAILEEYLKKPDKELKMWAKMAFDECKMFFEG